MAMPRASPHALGCLAREELRNERSAPASPHALECLAHTIDPRAEP
jgi:hypothetical protein